MFKKCWSSISSLKNLRRNIIGCKMIDQKLTYFFIQLQQSSFLKSIGFNSYTFDKVSVSKSYNCQ